MRKLLKRVVGTIIIFSFIFTNPSYGLGVAPGSENPGTKETMYALGQKLFAAKRGPGAIDLNIGEAGDFRGEVPSLPGIKFVEADYDHPPEGWRNNPILHKKDLIEAFEYFRDHEAKIPAEELEIKEGYFDVHEDLGEVPIARIEKITDGIDTKYVLVVHTKFVQMWNHIRKNDLWFEAGFMDGSVRTVSLAWGIFYRIAKHEMADLEKDTGRAKSLGHFVSFPSIGEVAVQENEMIANAIEGKYWLLNDAMWMWFLGSYCFSNTTRYNNDTFTDRLKWFFEGEDSGKMKLYQEFPGLAPHQHQQDIAIAIAAMVNYNFFSREGSEPREPFIDTKFIRDWEKREELVEGPSLYAAGGDIDNPVSILAMTEDDLMKMLPQKLNRLHIQRVLNLFDALWSLDAYPQKVEHKYYNEIFRRFLIAHAMGSSYGRHDMAELEEPEDKTLAILEENLIDIPEELYILLKKVIIDAKPVSVFREPDVAFAHINSSRFNDNAKAWLKKMYVYFVVADSIEMGADYLRMVLVRQLRGKPARSLETPRESFDFIKGKLREKGIAVEEFLSPEAIDVFTGEPSAAYMKLEAVTKEAGKPVDLPPGNAEPGNRPEHTPFLKVVSEYISQTSKDKGPGAIMPLTEDKKSAIWQSVNMLHGTDMEILLPRSVMLTEDVEDAVRGMAQRMKKRGRTFTVKRYREDTLLSELEKSKGRTDRIVITDKDTSQHIARLMLAPENVRAFKDVRVLNANIPRFVDENRLKAYQAKLIMTAALLRLVDKGDTHYLDIKSLLMDILEDTFWSADVDVSDFIDKMADSGNSDATSEGILNRVRYFISNIHAVDLVKKLELEIRAMQEFWTYA